MDLRLNADRFTGGEYINTYDRYRPTPPVGIIYQTLNYLNTTKADRIVDLGCGTGISTRVWSDFAEEIVGIEPSEEMIAIAIKNLVDATNIKYQTGYSNEIPLPANSVDCVTCSQSFHWMEPKSTLHEINRVLKENGVLVIYDVIWPPSVNFEYENAYNQLFDRVHKLTKQLQETIAYRWDKKQHVENVRQSGHFRFSKETYYHKSENFTKEQFIGIALSQGGLEALIKRGFSEDEIGINEFKKAVENMETPRFNTTTYNYRVVYGVKRT